MITVRQIERLWFAKAFDRLLEQLVMPRFEGSEQLLSHLSGALPAAAMAIIRLDELAKPFESIYSEMIRFVVGAQRPDGGWGDTMTSALCIRSLLCGNGNGESIDHGLSFLAKLQGPQGIWPNIPARRMPADPFASAFVLARLGDLPPFRRAVDIAAAWEWFEVNDIALDVETRRLWAHARRRTSDVGKSSRLKSPAASTGQVSFWDFTAALPV